MSTNSKVSIIITNYNYSRFLDECLQSCINQNFNHKYEIILIDDNSNKQNIKILNRLKKKFINKVIFLQNKKNIGISASANKAIKKANSKYFFSVDADDYVSNKFIRNLYNDITKQKNILGVACNYMHVKRNRVLKKLKHKKKPISCAILYNRKKFISYGGYNNNFRHREEEEVRKRLGKKYKISYIENYLYNYRMHNSNKTKQKKNMKIYYKKIYD